MKLQRTHLVHFDEFILRSFIFTSSSVFLFKWAVHLEFYFFFRLFYVWMCAFRLRCSPKTDIINLPIPMVWNLIIFKSKSHTRGFNLNSSLRMFGLFYKHIYSLHEKSVWGRDRKKKRKKEGKKREWNKVRNREKIEKKELAFAHLMIRV